MTACLSNVDLIESFVADNPAHLSQDELDIVLNPRSLMVDVRYAPREVQEIAFNKGLIPYIPADRQQGG